ncbi:calcium-binding protein [Okeania sp.]|uniref:calcium-binding protein n=1 Tax=Okeania sp. TaxID=3100323 RepID=UPI002B4ABE66|nr:calcium-binding protein [Okeania sp.]MEB3340004.1 calcium-binding protein [Okeania sp.]
MSRGHHHSGGRGEYGFFGRQGFFNDFNEIQGTEGDETLTGTTGSDRIFGDDGNDILNGDAENDYINGGNGNDGLTGDAGNDYLYGGDGNDILTGSSGIDQLHGGDGQDTFVFNIGSEVDWVRDFVVGEDILQLSANFGITAEQAVSQVSTIELGFMDNDTDNHFLSILNLGTDTLAIRHEGELTSDSFQIV